MKRKVHQKKEDKFKFKRKSQKQNKLHKILITVLVPLMFGILLTTLFSILIILLLSEYWANQGANSLAQQQYIYQTCTIIILLILLNQNKKLQQLTKFINNNKFQSYNQFMQLALTTLLGNSQQSIFQTISTIRTQIIHSFWTQQQESQYLDLQSLQVPQVIPLSISSQFITNFDKNTNQCLYCIGWGIVDINNLMTFNQQLSDLSIEQYSQLQQIVQTFQILQILYIVDNINQLYF